jgi:LytS/YehU family sensor histidine kinase
MGRVRKIRRQEKEKTRLQTQLAELRVQALRSQINPHFIFNCLAGIQEYVLQEQFMEANDYLTRFARLLRLTLERADQNFISLGQELELLRLYLELENTRLRQQIDYQIHVSEDASEDTMKIPAFIIQPFVENAIWHGLMHRKGAKKLYVDIAVNGTPDVGSGEQKMLKIEVTDNGVGREMSARIGRNKLGSQESKGMGIITERIRLIYPKASIRYEDLYDDAQQSAGTRVCIKIPLD